jgi:hypothetical protein
MLMPPKMWSIIPILKSSNVLVPKKYIKIIFAKNTISGINKIIAIEE